MASTAIDATKYTLVGVARHFDPSGKIAPIAEVLSVPDDLPTDMPWFPGNLATGHQTTQRIKLPAGTLREINDGVPTEVESTKPQVDAFASLESYSEIDEITMQLNGNEAAFRAQKDTAFVEGLTSSLSKYVFYGNSGLTVTHTGDAASTTYTVNPLGINGFAQRYTTTSGTITGGQCINAYSSANGSDCFSIWLVCWGPNKVYGIYPKGTPAGLQVEDLGKQTVIDYSTTSAASSKKYHEAYRTHFKWAAGLCVEDYRYVARAYNCDVSAKASWTLTDTMIKLLAKLPVGATKTGKPVFYMCGEGLMQLQLEASAKSNIWYQPSQLGGLPVTMFQTVPVHRCDLLTANEAAV